MNEIVHSMSAFVLDTYVEGTPHTSNVVTSLCRRQGYKTKVNLFVLFG